MNLDIVKNEIKEHLHDKVNVYVSALRNKSYHYSGVIIKMYPNLFIVKTDNNERSISYSEVATGDIKLTYYRWFLLHKLIFYFTIKLS